MTIELLSGPVDISQIRNTLNQLINQINAQAIGTGNVNGPGSSTVGNIPVFGDTEGTTITDSGVQPGNSPGNKIAVTNKSSAFTITIPAGGFIEYISVEETSGNTLTDGLDCGTTEGDNDVMAGLTVLSSSLQAQAGCAGDFGGSIVKSIFSTTDEQILYFDSSDWGSAVINLTLFYSVF